MDFELARIVGQWHAVVNEGDIDEVDRVVTNPLLVRGPEGLASISSFTFGEWIERSGVRLAPQSWYPLSHRVMIVEQHATWPTSTRPMRTATIFLATGSLVSATLRYSTLPEALEFARLYTALAEHDINTSDGLLPRSD